MKVYSFKEALARHPEITERPVNMKDLLEHFKPRERSSARALLIKMGPFQADRDGFPFENDFDLTADNFADFVKIFNEELVEQVVGENIFRYVDAMKSIKIPVPIFDDITLPDFIIDGVTNRVKAELTAQLLDLAIPSIGSGDFGRCGGMAFGAFDFYLQDRPVDGFSSTPPTEGPLGDYIYDRLLDSLNLNAKKFIEWLMILHKLPGLKDFVVNAILGFLTAGLDPVVSNALIKFINDRVDLFDMGGADELLDKTKDEWKTLKRRLDEQAAWPIGLIFSNKHSPFDQHQVLAIGYEVTSPSTAELKVWDNNFGPTESTFEIDFSGNTLEVNETPKPKNTRIIKGIFPEQYKIRVPPKAL